MHLESTGAKTKPRRIARHANRSSDMRTAAPESSSTMTGPGLISFSGASEGVVENLATTTVVDCVVVAPTRKYEIKATSRSPAMTRARFGRALSANPRKLW